MSAIDELKKMIDDDPDVGISLPARVDLREYRKKHPELDARLKELEDKSKWIDQWNDAKPTPTDEELVRKFCVELSAWRIGDNDKILPEILRQLIKEVRS